MNRARLCEYCGEEAQKSCKACNMVSYCTRLHQKKDWTRHKSQCETFKFGKDLESGRYLVAARDLAPGELIFVDPPLALGPRAASPLICLGCHELITEIDFKKCSDCSWPVCSSECAKTPQHVQECQILRRDIKKCGVPQQHGETPRYDLILIVRCLLLRSSNLSSWTRLMNMESHLERRKVDREPYHVAAVRYFTEVCKVDYPEDVIHHIRGAIITNCYETKGHSGASLRGMYHFLSLVNHSCLPNAVLRADKDGNMHVRSATSIKKGEMLVVAYTGTTFPFWERNQYVLTSHYFSCNCLRCRSLTELDTFFSSPRCQVCSKVGLSYDKATDEFFCSVCNFRDLSTKAVIEKSNAVLESIHSLTTASVSDMTTHLREVERVYHSGHFVWMEMAQVFLRLLSDHKHVEALRLKRDLWTGLLRIFDVVEPGMTRRRGMTLFKLGMAELALLENEEEKLEISSPDAQKDRKLEAMAHFQEAEDILKLEPSNSHELKWLEATTRILRVVEEEKNRIQS